MLLRTVLLVLAVISLVLAAFTVDSPTVNGHHMSWLIIGLAFWCASFIPFESYQRNRAP